MRTESAPAALCDPVLESLGVAHGFGRRGSQVPDSTRFPRQVHGADVLEVGAQARPTDAGEEAAADVIATGRPGLVVGIVTADCVPILAARADGRRVAAIHAGWRGLAAGVVEAGLASLLVDGEDASAGAVEIACAVGPAARGCCYEVDEPVRSALLARYPTAGAECLRPGRPGRSGHFQLDLGLLATRAIEAWLGSRPGRIGSAHRVCTICDPARFESHRRDGAAAGRLRHFIRRPMTQHLRG